MHPILLRWESNMYRQRQNSGIAESQIYIYINLFVCRTLTRQYIESRLYYLLFPLTSRQYSRYLELNLTYALFWCRRHLLFKKCVYFLLFSKFLHYVIKLICTYISIYLIFFIPNNSCSMKIKPYQFIN